MTVFDRYRIVPRAIALGLFGVAAYCVLLVTHSMVADGVNGEWEISALSVILVAMVTGSTSVVAMLGKAENDRQ